MRMFVRYAWVYSICIGMCLSGIALWRGEFSVGLISVPMQTVGHEMDAEETAQILQQPYHFLAKGRQTFVFESQDRKWVVKFFNNKYLRMPWYSFLLWDQDKEREKRERRWSFYLHSYGLAAKYLKEQTCIVYLHDGKTSGLPVIRVQDQTGRRFSIDLNCVPFVVQKKGDLLCDRLSIHNKGQCTQMLNSFLELIAIRISLGIADADHDVEHNFGYMNGRVFHLDPGRLFTEDLSDPARQAHEWWSATHNLRKWLEQNAPEVLLDFDEQITNWRKGCFVTEEASG